MAKNQRQKAADNRELARKVFNAWQVEPYADETVACLDIGTKSGLVIGNREGKIVCADWQDFTKQNGNPDYPVERGKLWTAYNCWLMERITDSNVSILVYEDVKRHMSHLSAMKFGGFKAVAQYTCWQANIHMLGCPVKAGKIALTGTGTASKDVMVNEATNYLLHDLAHAEMEFKSVPEDVADAVGLWRWFLGLALEELQAF